MNEAEFSRSIGEILTKRLTKEKATEQYARDTFDHPNKNEADIYRAVRLAVFGKLAGLQHQLYNIHEEIAKVTGRTLKSVEFKIQNVSCLRS